MGKWRVLPFARLHPWFRGVGGLLFHYILSTEILDKTRSPLARDKINGKFRPAPPQKTIKDEKMVRFALCTASSSIWGGGGLGFAVPFCLRLGSDLIDIHSHLNHYCESMEFIFSNCSLTSSLNRDQIRDGPLENLWGGGVGGRSTKRIIAQGKIKWKKIHARQWILKKYSCYGLEKIHTRNLITKNNSCGSKIPLPPPLLF